MKPIDDVTRQTFPGGESIELTFAHLDQTVRGANPEITAPICQQYPNVIGQQLRRILFIENGKLDSVKSRQTFFRGDPDIAVSSLRNPVDGILRQAVFGQPNLFFE